GFNDEYRGFSGGFEKALQGLKNAKGAGMKTGLRLTLTRRNAQEVGAMAELTAGQGIDRFYLSHLVYSGRGKHLTGEDLPPEETRMQLLELFLLAERMLEQGQPLRIVTGANDSGGPLLLRWIGERYGQEAGGKIHTLLKRRGGNSAGERLLAITHRGDVHPDQFWRKDTLGNVRRESLAEILAHPLLAMLRERDRHITGRCSGCAYLEICRGSHRERALAATGDVWSSDPACVMRDSEITTPAKVVAGGMA
ncbi:MAG: radical SAM protein, partial [Deltaproteobacteria bacterium]|nr:radical SAM protein [Deltaproteobacteria bacterium]